MTKASPAVCVFCGSRGGVDPRYAAAARATGRLFAERDWTLVYGGGRVGLMGELADACLEAGGRVLGVIPQMLLDREVGHVGLTQLEVVGTLSERKQRMSGLSQAFLALPGGIGTLDELFEVWTWGQLHLQRKPCALLNTAGYYDPLLTFLNRTVAEGFLSPEHRAGLIDGPEPGPLLDRLVDQLSIIS
jgi:uncharacterized protein (TIGR00730 family)